MTKIFPLLLVISFALAGCGKVRLGDPMALPGTGEILEDPTVSTQTPKFQNGDLVRYRSLKNSYGVMMHCDYKYIPRLKSYYCIVDFYPSSSISLGLSRYDNYERRYVYEYELVKIADVPPRWTRYDGLIK